MFRSSEFDKDPFILYTPDGVYDLRKGPINSVHHKPEQHLTKMTTCSPNDEGKELWLESINKIFSRDKARRLS